ncbi:AraC family transcriptional regulator [Caenimonas sp. S4]|nr:AraC family transcriptional regulator [Caenimonas soli]
MEVQQGCVEEHTFRSGQWHSPTKTSKACLYYVVSGRGTLTTEKGDSIPIAAQTLVVVPPGARAQRPAIHPDVGGSSDLRLICGEFQATFGEVVDLFSGSPAAIVERFEDGDALHNQLRLALEEMRHEHPGRTVMVALLIKHALLLLLRRALTSPAAWVEQIAALRDPRISRAFVEMTKRPGAAHSVESLASAACLSRSGFMARFCDVFGRAPMSVLRDLRMRQAAQQLRTTSTPIGLIGRAAGYSNNGGFIRAFRRSYGVEPREYREQSLASRDAPAARTSGTSAARTNSPSRFTVSETLEV